MNNMQKKLLHNYIYLILFVLCALIEGCEVGSEHLLAGEEMPVRILATIDVGYAKPMNGDASSIRSGMVNEETAGYEEQEEEGTQLENNIGTVRVMAFDQDGAIQRNVLFKKPGVVTDPGEKSYQYADGTGTTITKIQMELKIEPADYLFVLVANEKKEWKLETIIHQQELQDNQLLQNIENTITTREELSLAVTGRSGIPMLGLQEMTIPYDQSASELNPAVINPAIELKRTIAKVEVNISNVDTQTGMLFETAKYYTIKSVSLFNANRQYALLEELTEPITEDNYDVTNDVFHTEGAPFTGNILNRYMAERKNIDGSETDATKIRIVASGGGEDFNYDIPLFQHSGNGRNYDIRRNTIYRLNTLLHGKLLTYELDVYNIVEGWNNIYGEINIAVPKESFVDISSKYMPVTSVASGGFSGEKQFIIYTNLDLTESDFYEVQESGFSLEWTANPSGHPGASYLLTVKYRGDGFGGKEKVPVLVHFSTAGKKVFSITIEAVVV